MEPPQIHQQTAEIVPRSTNKLRSSRSARRLQCCCTQCCKASRRASLKWRELSRILIATGWWLSPTPLKNMNKSVGMMTFPIYGKIKNHVPNHQPYIYINDHGMLHNKKHVEICNNCLYTYRPKNVGFYSIVKIMGDRKS